MYSNFSFLFHCILGFPRVLLDALSYGLCFLLVHRGADKSIARPGRKQTTATEDFGFIYPIYEGWNFNSGNYLFTTDTK